MAEERVVIFMPAYNAGHLIERTYQEIPEEFKSSILLVNDGSTDDTEAVAKRLGIKVISHSENKGYGAAQKTGYAEALKNGADIVVMVHSDYQHDPSYISTLIEPLKNGQADIALGSRILAGKVVSQGMPFYKFLGNRLVTGIENLILQANISDYHTGFRAYRREALEKIPFQHNSDGYIFDSEFLIQAVNKGLRIKEVPIPTRYPKEASSIDFFGSVKYGLGILGALARFLLHRSGIKKSPQFE